MFIFFNSNVSYKVICYKMNCTAVNSLILKVCYIPDRGWEQNIWRFVAWTALHNYYTALQFSKYTIHQPTCVCQKGLKTWKCAAFMNDFKLVSLFWFWLIRAEQIEFNELKRVASSCGDFCSLHRIESNKVKCISSSCGGFYELHHCKLRNKT